MNKTFTIPEIFCFRILCKLIAGVVLPATAISGCGMGAKLTRVVEEFPQAHTCGHCHIDIFREWSASPHATAYTNPQYREATDEYRFTACLGCHTPEPSLSNDVPLHRTIYRDEGVTCVSCHLEEGELTGPISPSGTVAPHPMAVDSDLYHDSRFCGRCHEGTYAEWNTATMEDKLSCQQCHMPQIIRKITQPSSALSKLIVSFEENVVQKRHTFASVPEELELKPYSLEIIRLAGKARIILTNHLPHALPSGDFGVRIIALIVSIVDTEGNAITIAERELIKDLGSAIPTQSSLAWELDIPPGARELSVRMMHRGYEHIDTRELIKTVIFTP